MHNFSTTSADKEPTISNNMAIINSAYDNEAYHYWVSATMLEDAGDTSIPTYHIGDINNGMPPYWILACDAAPPDI